MAAYGCGILRYGAGVRSAAPAYESLTAARLLHAYNCRRQGRRPGTNPYLTLATAASFALQLAPFFVPGLGRVLKIAPLTPVDLAIAGANAGLAPVVNNRLRRRQPKPLEEYRFLRRANNRKRLTSREPRRCLPAKIRNLNVRIFLTGLKYHLAEPGEMLHTFFFDS